MARLDPFGDRHGVSGHWTGHYHHDSPTQAGRTYPIAATLWETRGHVEGVMTDAVTHSAYSLRKVLDNAEAMGLVPAAIFARMISLHPDAIMETDLPTDSVIRGRLRGDVLSFTKTYEGGQETRYRDASMTLATAVRTLHRVHYSGVLDVARGVIEGTWEIRRPGPFGRFFSRLGTGTFFLARNANPS